MARSKFVTLQTRGIRGMLKQKVSRTRAALATQDCFTDMLETFIRVIMRPDVLAAVVISVLVVITHMDNFDKGPIGSLFTDKTSKLAVFLKDNEKKLMGVATMIPTIIAAAPKSRFPLGILILSAIFIMKSLPVYHYTVTSLAVMMFMKARLPFTRLLVLVSMCVFVYYDIAIFVEKHSATAAATATISPNGKSG